MPFKSKSQAKFMFANHPKIAKRFAAETKSIKALPNYKKGTKDAKTKRVRGGGSGSGNYMKVT